MFTLWDKFAAGTAILFVAFWQAVAIGWFYGESFHNYIYTVFYVTSQEREADHGQDRYIPLSVFLKYTFTMHTHIIIPNRNSHYNAAMYFLVKVGNKTF